VNREECINVVNRLIEFDLITRTRADIIIKKFDKRFFGDVEK